MRRPLIYKTPDANFELDYEPLKSVDGKTVGYKCKECGRLCGAPHFDHCSIGRKHANTEVIKTAE